jgi:predicted transcriptional regulator
MRSREAADTVREKRTEWRMSKDRRSHFLKARREAVAGWITRKV